MILDAPPHGTSGKAPLHQEDALRFIVDSLARDAQKFKNYGYDVYVTRAAEQYAREVDGLLEHMEAQRRMYEISPIFFDAAWELCKRGILRPGITSWGQQMTDDGSAGNGYSITPFGRDWLSSDDRNVYVPTEPERFAQLLAGHKDRFGAGFHQRAMEAVKCYGAHAYLAACTMSGAATESILLAVACAKIGEDEALRQYRGRDGRRNIIKALVGTDERLKSDLNNQLSLLSYWRDDAAHGTQTKISDPEAFVALAMLLRVAQFFEDNWSRFAT